MRNGFLAALFFLTLLAVPVLGQSPVPGEALPLVAPASPATEGCPDLWSGAGDCEERPPRVWFRADYLLWWIKDGPLPVPLATRGGSFAPNFLIGTAGTDVILGGKDQDFGTFAGGRISHGRWFGSEQTFGVDISAFLLESRSVFGLIGSDAAGSPTLSRPLIGSPSGFVISSPGSFSGGLAFAMHSEFFGGDGNLRLRLANSDDFQLQLLGGLRYHALVERLTDHQQLNLIALGNPPPDIILGDRFYTINMFFGCQVGAEAEFHQGNLFVDVSGKLALGDSWQRLQASDFGLLAAPSRTEQNRFAVVPEVEVDLGYQLTSCLRGFIGYNFLYWSSVLRPGDQIAPLANLTFSGAQFKGTHPTALHPSSFWAQGLSFGVEVRF
jgi:hypothetical protein